MAWAQLHGSGVLQTTRAHLWSSPGAQHRPWSCTSPFHTLTEPSQLPPWTLPLSLLAPCQGSSIHTYQHMSESRSAHFHLAPRTTFLIAPCTPASRSHCTNRLKPAKPLPPLVFHSSADSERWSAQHLAYRSATWWRHDTGLATNLWLLSSSVRTISLLHRLFLKLELKRMYHLCINTTLRPPTTQRNPRTQPTTVNF